jgi:hydroxymethylpyrimidine kinase/phosphomethylpyrimidine kinase
VLHYSPGVAATRVCALAVGGNDPGGGAGILADLRGFAAAGAFGCAAIAVVTVQSTAGLRSARAVDARELIAQIREVTAHQRVGCVKVGALGSRENVVAVTRWARTSRIPIVVDPVMLPTRGRGGARLLDVDALDAMRALVAEATLVTANAPEAAALVGAQVESVEEARLAALALSRMGARAVLVKGGHVLVGAGRDAVDVLVVPGSRPVVMRSRRLELGPLHGGGCVLAALIAGKLAMGSGSGRRPVVTEAAIVGAVRWARRVHRRALASLVDVGGPMRVLVPPSRVSGG